MAFADLVASADRAALASLGGEPVVYAAEFCEPVTITGIFESNFPLLTPYGFAGTERLGPSVFLLLADLPTNPNTGVAPDKSDPDLDDATLTIRGHTYKIRERERDGLGGIHCNLYEVP
jgi:hypothetical protein